MHIKAELTESTGRVLWTDTESMLPSIASPMDSTTWQQLRDDPKLIEAKHEFIQISIEVRGLHRAMVGTQHPALEQRCDAMHTRHGYLRGEVRTGHHGALVEVAKLTQGAVGGRTIRMHRGVRFK